MTKRLRRLRRPLAYAGPAGKITRRMASRSWPQQYIWSQAPKYPPRCGGADQDIAAMGLLLSTSATEEHTAVADRMGGQHGRPGRAPAGGKKEE